MGFQLSPGVAVSEIDNTTVIGAVATTAGAFAGQFTWGPVNKRLLIDSQNTLVSIYGKPTDNNYVSFFSASNFLDYGNNLRVVRVANTASYNATANGNGVQIQNRDQYELSFPVGSTTIYGPIYSRYPGAIGNSLQVAICSTQRGFKYTGITANTISGNNFIVTSANVQPYVSANDILNVGTVNYTITGFTTNNTVIVSSNAGTTANGVTAYTTWQFAPYFDTAPTTSIYAGNNGSANDEMHIIVIDSNGKFTGIKNTVLEVYPHVSKASDAKTDNGTVNYWSQVLVNKSNYVYAAAPLSGTTTWGSVSTNISFDGVANYSTVLSGGTDALVTDADIINGFSQFQNAEEVDVSLLVTADADATVATYVLSLAAARKDCVAFVSPLIQDAVNSPNVDNIVTYRNSLPSTSYGFMDSGWKYQFDKFNNKYRYIPLNGDTAGLCARTDSIRDPWWSPAGFNRGQILNAIKLSWNPTQAQRDVLYPNNINPVVSFPGQGILLYGDKTMQAKTSAFDRINVRRLFIVLEKAIATAAKYSLFEFNDEFTRNQFISIVEPFLRQVKGRRGITDYKVVCDSTNNTQQIIDTNQFVADVYISPNRSVNFIQLNIIATRTGVSFTEIAGAQR